jgi:hypothetical protein
LLEADVDARRPGVLEGVVQQLQSDTQQCFLDGERRGSVPDDPEGGPDTGSTLDRFQAALERPGQSEPLQDRWVQLEKRQPQLAQRFGAERLDLSHTLRGLVRSSRLQQTIRGLGEQRHAVDRLGHRVVQFAGQPVPFVGDRHVQLTLAQLPAEQLAEPGDHSVHGGVEERDARARLDRRTAVRREQRGQRGLLEQQQILEELPAVLALAESLPHGLLDVVVECCRVAARIELDQGGEPAAGLVGHGARRELAGAVRQVGPNGLRPALGDGIALTR